MAVQDDDRGRRVRVGLTGLAAILVIAAALAAVFEGVRDDGGLPDANSVELANAGAPASEPLADIGVVPPSEGGNEVLDLKPSVPPQPVTPTPPPRPIE